MKINKPSQKGRTTFHRVIITLLCFTVMALMVTPSVAAFEFDNTAYYDEENRIYTIKDCTFWVGTCFVDGDTIAKIELITPQIFNVGLGYQYVAEFELRDYDVLYGNAFQDMNFYQINNEMNEFTREFDYRYLTYETEIRNTYVEVCENDEGDITCEYIENGTEEYQVEKWEKFSDINELPQQNSTRIRIYTNVHQGDYVEWIPTLFGEYLEEWAIWEGNLSTSLISYYGLDETTGNLTETISPGDNTDLAEQGTVGTADGIYSNSRGVYSNSDFFQGEMNTTVDFTTSSIWSISAWFNVNTSANEREIYNLDDAPLEDNAELLVHTRVKDNKLFVSASYRGVSGDDNETVENVSFGEWNNVVLVHNVSGGPIHVYLNGTYAFQVAALAAGSQKADWLVVGKGIDTSTPMNDGLVDEIGIWNRELTAADIAALYNDGLGCNYNNESCLIEVDITLNSPADTLNSSTDEIEFNATATSLGATLVNMSLWTNETSWSMKNTTGMSGDATKTETWTRTLVDGNYIWNVRACDTSGVCGFASSNFTLNIDGTPPSVVINAPTTNMNNNYAGGNETLNWTISDGGTLDTCWYTYNNTNTTVTCGDAGAIFALEQGDYTLTMWANDTVGNINSSTVTWDYDVFENSQTYSASATEFAVTEFSLNITYNSSSWSSITGILNYDGTNYTATSSSGTDTKIFNRTLTIPTVDADVNNTFYWIIRLTNDTGTYFYNSQSNNQTVLNLGFDNCGVNTDVLFNLTLVDEDTQVAVNGTIEVDLSIYGEDSTETVDFYNKFEDVENATVCINNNLSGSNLYLDSKIKYYNGEHSVEYYNIQKYDLNTTTLTQNITLYDLNLSAATIFDIYYKGNNFLPLADAVIQVTREYVGEGVFKTVEIPITDIDGKATASLVKDSGIYTLYIYSDNVLQATFNNVIPVCSNELTGDCTINLNAPSSSASVTDFTALDDILYQLTWDEDLMKVEVSYSTITGASTDLRLHVLLLDAYENETICDTTLSSAAGTLSCTVPPSYTNQTILVKMYKTSSPSYQIGQWIISLFPNKAEIFGLTGYLLAFIMIIMIPFMFITSLVGMVIGLMMGVVLTGMLLLSGGVTVGTVSLTIGWFSVACAILIWKLNQTERRG